MRLVDSHMHLPECADREEVLSEAGFRGMVLFTASTDETDSAANLGLREAHPGVLRCFVGVHPSRVTDKLPSERLLGMVQRADGIGEIGLDPKYSEAGEGSQQMLSFTDQLGMAERQGVPVEVHSRDSQRACLDHLSSYHLRGGVLLHWFEGEEHLAETASRGYYVSFGPAILYSKRLRRIAARYPRELILTESDAPVPYRPLGAHVSGPSLIASVVFCLAEELGMGFTEAGALLDENSMRFLNGGPEKVNLKPARGCLR